MTKYDDILYQSGLIADGCWDQLDSYAQEAIFNAFDLIIKQERETLIDLVYSYANSLSWNENFLADLRARGG